MAIFVVGDKRMKQYSSESDQRRQERYEFWRLLGLGALCLVITTAVVVIATQWWNNPITVR
ncbi:MAG: hypothetical protein HZB70_01210 [Candidatus Berkelbacteria bacterium]|nr:MAG: hypothetical protein HZB70_01210 [Candidatus Berkelbacteria bacterium]QQG52042.1 MAG: hypothetical protein HY845_01785 [Candidatus Berkelbacteria bacterium]